MADQLLDTAKSLVPMILSNLDRIDAECQLPPELASALADKQLFCMYAPKSLGGPEADPITAFHVVEEVAKADGSVGWCVFNGSAVTAATSRLTAEAAKEIFGDPPVLLGSGSARPEGVAKLTEGGYLVSGRWNYLSGIDHSIALFLNCAVIDDNGPVLAQDGSQVTRVAVVPVAAGTVLNTWTTLGMRGTASNDAEFFDVFVPTSHTYTRGDPAYHDGPLYHPPQTATILGWTLSAANTLGMARGAMNAFLDLAMGSGSTDSKTLLRDRPHVQIIVGECEAMIDSARSHLLDAVGAMWESQVQRSPDVLEKAPRARLAITHAIRQSVDVVDKLFNAAGTNAIHHSVGLERFFRDLHVHGQHISGLAANYEYGGSILMGATPRSSLYG
jgi:alkylation response protein AidB-like acyl-CoA dehydrogenase